jgi:hypothetical protein
VDLVLNHLLSLAKCLIDRDNQVCGFVGFILRMINPYELLNVNGGGELLRQNDSFWCWCYYSILDDERVEF